MLSGAALFTRAMGEDERGLERIYEDERGYKRAGEDIRGFKRKGRGFWMIGVKDYLMFFCFSIRYFAENV